MSMIILAIVIIMIVIDRRKINCVCNAKVTIYIKTENNPLTIRRCWNGNEAWGYNDVIRYKSR